MAPRRKTEHPIEVHPEYLAELRRRVEEGPGATAVAKAARMSRTTLWGLLNDPTDRRATAEAAERVRHALGEFEPTVEPLPPPTVSVRGLLHHRWIAFGEALIATHPAAVQAALEAPATLTAAVVGTKTRATRRRR